MKAHRRQRPSRLRRLRQPLRLRPPRRRRILPMNPTRTLLRLLSRPASHGRSGEEHVKKRPKAPKPQTASKRTPLSKASTGSTVSPSKWIRIERPFPLPAYVKDALQRLDEAGHIAYVVGGSLRDFLLGREIKDYDIATSAGPDELCALFPKA